jgi:hypothetical protein
MFGLVFCVEKKPYTKNADTHPNQKKVLIGLIGMKMLVKNIFKKWKTIELTYMIMIIWCGYYLLSSPIGSSRPITTKVWCRWKVKPMN